MNSSVYDLECTRRRKDIGLVSLNGGIVIGYDRQWLGKLVTNCS